MNRINIREQIFNFIAFFLIQLPLLYRIVLFDQAFGFFYLGFLLLLPYTWGRVYLMIIGFFAGLVVDVFSNTPGIHASACVLIMFFRGYWLRIVHDDVEELTNINHISLKKTGFLAYILPLVFLHHLVIFTLENGGLHLFGSLISKVFLSSLLSFIIIFVLNIVIAPRLRRI